MKSTASNPTVATEHQRKGSRQNTASGAQAPREPVNAAASASQKATARARRGDLPAADSKTARSPKQENL